jgi:hypothetical protein
MTYRFYGVVVELAVCIGLTLCGGCRTPQSASPAGPEMHHYFGNPHSHTSFSDGKGELVDLVALAEKNGFDFYAVTDHALTKYPGYTAANYEFTKRQADRLTHEGFVVIAGFEFSENDGPGAKGHAGALNAAGTLNATGPDCDYPRFFDWLGHNQATPVVVSFNHAGAKTYNGWNFGTKVQPEVVALFEVINSGKPHEDGFRAALDHGWRVAPVGALDNHGPGRITDSEYRTGVLAKALTRDAIIGAMLQRHVYCTWDKNLKVTCTVNGVLSGAVLPKGKPLKWVIWVEDPDTNAPNDKITRIEIIGPEGKAVAGKDFDGHSVRWETETAGEGPYYFATVYAADKTDGPTAYASPVWLK